MTSTRINCVASMFSSVVIALRFKHTHKEAALEAIRKCQEITRKEPGCEFYDLWHDRDDPQLYYLLERWTQQEYLDQHLKQPHVAELRAALAECVSERSASHCRFVQ